MIKKAEFSKDKRYRYSLSRIWDQSKPGVQFVLLNPSTADEKDDDPTVRRCVGFAKRWGYGFLEIRNIFSLRCTNPINLRCAARPIGENKIEDILTSLSVFSFDKIVFGWGVHGKLMNRGQNVINSTTKRGMPIYCFGFTKNEQPKHPLYLRNSAPLVHIYEEMP